MLAANKLPQSGRNRCGFLFKASPLINLNFIDFILLIDCDWHNCVIMSDEVNTTTNSLSAFGHARSTVNGTPLSPEELQKHIQYFNATMYLCLGMIYLRDNPLLLEPLDAEHIKRRQLGHWGSDAGQRCDKIDIHA